MFFYPSNLNAVIELSNNIQKYLKNVVVFSSKLIKLTLETKSFSTLTLKNIIFTN